uniref:Sugar transporter SWEET1 n=1 Tax=Anopheles dirus TaxID=7168 RepID=A0A182NQ79_9DIPT
MEAILSKGSLAALSTIATVLQFLTGTCFMWLKYGVLTEESTLILVNFIGSALFFSYTVVFFVFSVNKREVVRQMMLISCIILSATIYTSLETSLEKSVRVIGLLCCCLAVLFFASPFAKLAHVIRTQNTDSLPFPIIVSSFFVCLLWTAYGVLINDLFIQIPNLLGGILAGIQLTLYVIYPKQKASSSGGPRYSPLVSENPIL